MSEKPDATRKVSEPTERPRKSVMTKSDVSIPLRAVKTRDGKRKDEQKIFAKENTPDLPMPR
jgi:hypothetical protein